MRVLYVIPSVGPVYGGPSLCVPALASAVGAAGADLQMAATNANGRDVLDVPLGVPVREDGFAAFYFQRQWPRALSFSWPMTKWLRRHAGDYDLLHIHSVFNYPASIAARAARRAGVPYVVTPHGMLEPWALGYKAWKKRPYYWAIEKKTLAGAAALHALADSERDHFRAHDLPAPSFVLPNGIQAGEFSDLPPRSVFEGRHPGTRGKKLVLFLGRIDPKKGLDLLVPAFAALLREKPGLSAHLVIAGPDLTGYRKSIEALVREENIGGLVTFTGELRGEEKYAALGAADLFVLPSRSEGFSVAVLEAMAAGLPVVITEGCNFPEAAGAGAGRVIALDADELAKAFTEILENEELRRSMGERGRALVTKKYHWPVIAGRMIEVYRDILAERREAKAWRS